MSDRGVYLSTTCFEQRDVEGILSDLARLGGDALEISTVEPFDLARLDAADAPRVLLHNYFGASGDPFVLNLASSDSQLLQRSRAHCRAALDASARLGAPVFAGHAGYTADLEPRLLGDPAAQAQLPEALFTSAERAYETLCESVRQLVDYGRSVGVRFLVENHVLAAAAGRAGRRLLQLVTPDDLLGLVADVEGAALLVDVGHLNVSAHTLGFDPVAALAELAPHTGALHLSGNDGSLDAHEPFAADAWFGPLVPRFAAAEVTVELRPTPIDLLAEVRDTVLAWRRASPSRI